MSETQCSALSDLNARVADLAATWAHLPMAARLDQIEWHLESDGEFDGHAITEAVADYSYREWCKFVGLPIESSAGEPK